MKILIYFLCFFVFALIGVALQYLGIVFSGAIPSVIQTVLALLCARGLCKAWDIHKERKAIVAGIEAQQEAEYKDDIQIRVISGTNNESPDRKMPNRQSKKRYCKFCGGAIDGESRKCTKCGKQYFRIRKAHVLAVIAIVVILSLAILNVYQFNRYQTDCAYFESRIDELTATIRGLNMTVKEQELTLRIKETEISDRKSKYTELSRKNYALLEEIRFYDTHIVFVNDDGTKLYHKYDCDKFGYHTFWAYNTEAAKSRGYKPCSKCCK